MTGSTTNSNITQYLTDKTKCPLTNGGPGLATTAGPFQVIGGANSLMAMYVLIHWSTKTIADLRNEILTASEDIKQHKIVIETTVMPVDNSRNVISNARARIRRSSEELTRTKDRAAALEVTTAVRVSLLRLRG